MLRRQAGIAPGQRFFQPDRQAVLIAAGDQGRACSGTDSGVSIGLQEPDTVGG